MSVFIQKKVERMRATCPLGNRRLFDLSVIRFTDSGENAGDVPAWELISPDPLDSLVLEVERMRATCPLGNSIVDRSRHPDDRDRGENAGDVPAWELSLAPGHQGASDSRTWRECGRRARLGTSIFSSFV